MAIPNNPAIWLVDKMPQTIIKDGEPEICDISRLVDRLNLESEIK